MDHISGVSFIMTDLKKSCLHISQLLVGPSLLAFKNLAVVCDQSWLLGYKFVPRIDMAISVISLSRSNNLGSLVIWWLCPSFGLNVLSP